jgi:hypothetical protein
MQAESSSRPSGPPGPAGIGTLVGVGIIGVAIILVMLYKFW